MSYYLELAKRADKMESPDHAAVKLLQEMAQALRDCYEKKAFAEALVRELSGKLDEMRADHGG